MAGGPGGKEVGRISIRAVPDTSKFRKELQAKLEGIEKGLKVEVPIDPDTKGFRSKVKAATSNLPDAKVKVNADVDRRSLSGTIARAFDKIPSVKLGTGINPAGYGVIAVALAATIAPALGLITTALAAIPGILSAIAAPIAAITLGLDGIKKAAAPLTTPFEQLKTTMNAVNETKFLPVFEKLATVFPTLQGSLPKVSQGLATMAQAFVDAASSPENLGKLESTISNIATGLTNAAPGIGGFTNGIISMADTLAQKFPKVGEWFSGAGEDFQRFIDKITQNGDLSDAFGGLGDTLKTIFDLAGKLGKQGLDFMGDPAKVERMASAFQNIASAIDRIATGSNKFFDVLDRIENSKPNQDLEKGGFGNLLKEGFDPNNLFGGDDKIAPDWLQRAFGGDHDIDLRPEGILKQINDWFQAPVAKIVDFFGNTLGVGMATAAAETGPSVGQAFGDNIQKGLQEKIQGGSLFGSAIDGGAAPKIDPQAILGQVTPAIDAAKAQIAAIGPALQAAIAPLQQIPAQIQTVFGGIGAAVAGSMATVVSTIAGAAQQIVAAFGANLAQIPGIATTTFAQVAAAATSGMAQVVAAITTGMQQGVAAVQAGGQQIIAALQAAAAGAQAAGAAVGQGMASGIRGSIGGAVAAARELASAVAAAAKVELGVKSPSTVFRDIGMNTVEGFNNGFDENSQSAIDRASSLAQSITQAMNTGLSGIDTEGLTTQVRDALAALELERKQLKVQANDADAVGNKDLKKSLQDRMKEIQVVKDQLALQKDQLGLNTKQEDSMEKQDDLLGSTLTKMMDIGTGFAMANVKQFQSDIGIGGEGAISQLADIGLGWGSQMMGKLISGGFGAGTTINVNSVDDALAAKQNLANKKALQYTQRGSGK